MRPPAGTRILLTRPCDQVEELKRRFTELGAEVMIQPAIRISDPPDWKPVDNALEHLDRYDWLVFSSVNGVRDLLDRLCGPNKISEPRGLSPRQVFFKYLKLAAIGPATAEALDRYHLRADLVPKEYRAESLACELAKVAAGRRFLLARASRGRDVLAEQITSAGGVVEQIVVYSSTDVDRAEPDVTAALLAGRIDWITVTSSAIAGALVGLFGEQLHRSKLASISPVTSGTLRRLGHQPAVEAAEYTVEGLVKAILAHR